MDRLARFLGDDLQVGLPHVATDELQPLGEVRTELTEEGEQGPHGVTLADPEEAAAAVVDLVDDGEELVRS
jgi:hypothetical protein